MENPWRIEDVDLIYVIWMGRGIIDNAIDNAIENAIDHAVDKLTA